MVLNCIVLNLTVLHCTIVGFGARAVSRKTPIYFINKCSGRVNKNLLLCIFSGMFIVFIYMMHVLLKKPGEEELWGLNRAVLVSFTIAHFRAAPTRNSRPIFIHFTPHASAEICQNFAK